MEDKHCQTVVLLVFKNKWYNKLYNCLNYFKITGFNDKLCKKTVFENCFATEIINSIDKNVDKTAFINVTFEFDRNEP